MVDIFEEVNAELRRDRLRAVWQKYGFYVIGFIVLVVLSVAGTSGFTAYTKSQNEKASAAYDALMIGLPATPPEQRLAALTAFRGEHNNAYGVLADFQKAKLHQSAGQHAQAVAIYDGLAADGSLPRALRDYARVAAAYGLIDTATTAALETRLRDLLRPKAAFRHSAREVLILSYFQGGDYLAAREVASLALADPELPPALASRIDVVRKNIDSYLLHGDKTQDKK